MTSIHVHFITTTGRHLLLATTGTWPRTAGRWLPAAGNSLSAVAATIIPAINNGHGAINVKPAATESKKATRNATMATRIHSTGNLDLSHSLCSCDSTCQVERGWTCKDATSKKPSKCKQVCGDGITFLPLPWTDYCDDGNLENGDGCDSTCHVEKGYSCTGGNKYQSAVCIEICGDGLNFGHYECDDGNSISGDG